MPTVETPAGAVRGLSAGPSPEQKGQGTRSNASILGARRSILGSLDQPGRRISLDFAALIPTA
eukprot:7445058-Pyramimonas_sp.AAC.1